MPHYCFHPGLPIAGNCRMCLVEIEKAPKLQIACNTRVAEGMVVHTQSRSGEGRAHGGARVPADQPPDRLPGLRSGRRVQAAGLHVPGRAAGEPIQPDVRQALQPGGRFRARRLVRAEPLHPVYALRALHGGRGEGAGAEHLGARRPSVRRHPSPGPARPLVGRQRGRPVPRGFAPVQGFSPQGPRLGARQDRVGLHRLFARVQRHPRYPGQCRRADPPAAQPGGQQLLHVRSRPRELPLAESRGPDRGAAGAAA